MPSPGVDLSGKTAIVTGSGQGLGRAMATALAGAGANIVLVGRTPETLADAARECEALAAGALPAVCDVTERDRVDALVDQVRKELGGPHILINNAGISRPSPIGEMSDELWHTTLETNLSAAFYFCRAAGRYMLPAGEGKVVNVGSSAGSRGRPNQAAYAASKAGIDGLTKALAVEWAPSGIQVNCIAPGRFRTPLAAERIDDPEESERSLRMVPMKRYAAPGEIGELVLFL
ncbi:MAG: SDR family NAD(P)-dependent oxidoreductase [Nitrospinota bacterium]